MLLPLQVQNVVCCSGGCPLHSFRWLQGKDDCAVREKEHGMLPWAPQQSTGSRNVHIILGHHAPISRPVSEAVGVEWCGETSEHFKSHAAFENTLRVHLGTSNWILIFANLLKTQFSSIIHFWIANPEIHLVENVHIDSTDNFGFRSEFWKINTNRTNW